MEAIARLRADRLGRVATGIVLGTASAALGLSWLWLLCLGAGIVALLRRQGILVVAVLATSLLIATARGTTRASPWDPASSLRGRLLEPLVVSMPGDAGALAAGLTLGDASYFSRDLRDAMRKSSTTHLVALSGFNAALMLGLARRILSRFGRKAADRGGLLLLGCLVLLAGFQPSLLRAALVATIGVIGEATGRRIGAGRLTVIAAAVMLAVFPGFAGDLGFLLSFTSSWAILATVGDMERMLASGQGSLRDTIVAGTLPSAVAQLGVAPVLLASVGSVMLVGLLVNPLVLPMTPLITAAAGFQLAISSFSAPLATLTGPLAAALSWPSLALIRLAAALPMTVSLALPAGIAAAAYAAWFLAVLARKPRLW